MFLKNDCSDMVKEDSLSLTEIDIVHKWEFVIFIHFLVTAHIFQPAFVVISDLNSVWIISCIIDHTVDSVSHFLIFEGHRVALESCPCIIIGNQGQLGFWVFELLRFTASHAFSFFMYQPFNSRSQPLGRWISSWKESHRHRRTL